MALTPKLTKLGEEERKKKQPTAPSGIKSDTSVLGAYSKSTPSLTKAGEDTLKKAEQARLVGLLRDSGASIAATQKPTYGGASALPVNPVRQEAQRVEAVRQNLSAARNTPLESSASKTTGNLYKSKPTSESIKKGADLSFRAAVGGASDEELEKLAQGLHARTMQSEGDNDSPRLEKVQYIQNELTARKDKAFYADLAERKSSLESVQDNADFRDIVDRTLGETWRSGNQITGNARVRNAVRGIQLLQRRSEGAQTDDPAEDAVHMTKEQRDTMLYYAGSGQWDKAEAYLDVIDRELNQRVASNRIENAKSFSEKHPVVGAAGNVAASFVSPLAWFGNVVQMAKNTVTGTYEPTDTNSDWFIGSQLTSATAEGVSKAAEGMPVLGGIDIAGKNLGSFVAETGLSIGQFLSKVPLGPLSLAYMGAGAAGDTTYEALEGGATNSQALLLGTASGLIEAATEKIGLDNLFGILKKSGKRGAVSVLADIASQIGSEASEEAISEVANNLVELAVLGENSDLKQYIAALMQSGMDQKQAEAQAFKQFFIVNTMWAAAGGALSGGLVGGGAVTPALIEARVIDVKTGKAVKMSTFQYNSVQLGMRFAPESETYKLSSSISRRLDQSEGAVVSNAEIGRLVQMMRAEAEQYGPTDANTRAAVEQAIRGNTAEQAGKRAEKVITPAAQTYMDAGVDAVTADAAAEVAMRVQAGDATLKRAEMEKLELQNPVMRQTFTAVTGIEVPEVGSAAEAVRAVRDIVSRQAQEEQARADRAAQMAEEFLAIQKQAAEQAAARTKEVRENADSRAQEIQDQTVSAEATASEGQGGAAYTPDMSQDEFVAAYLSENPGATEAAAVSAYADMQMRAAVPGLSYTDGRKAANAAARAGQIETKRSSLGTEMPTETSTENGLKTAPAQSSTKTPTKAQEWTVKNANYVLSKRKGAPRVELSFDLGEEHGFYDPETNTIKLNAEVLDSQQPLVYTLSHELVHAAKANGDTALVDDLISFAEGITTSEAMQGKFDSTRARYIRFYTGREGYSREAAEALCTTEFIREEVAADIMRDVFRSTGGMYRLAQQNGGLLSKLLEGVQEAASRIKVRVGGRSESAQNARAMYNAMTDLVDKMDRALRSAGNRGTMSAENTERGVRRSVGREADESLGAQERRRNRAVPGISSGNEGTGRGLGEENGQEVSGQPRELQSVLANDRRYSVPEMADTNTPEFRAWFHDDTGELTNEDGTPKIFLRGDAHSGGTKFYSGDEAKSRGIFFSRNMDTARIYGARDLPEGAKEQVQEFIPRVVNSWAEAEEFVRDSLRENVKLEKKGKRWILSTKTLDVEWDSIADYDMAPGGLAEFNADYDADLKSWDEAEQYAEENFADGYAIEFTPDGVSVLEQVPGWKEYGKYADTRAGLARFNAEYGDAVQQNNVVNPGYMQVYLSAKKTRIIDAEGRKWNNVDGYGMTTDDFAEQSWAEGYDMVIVKNVQDGNSQGKWAFDEYDNWKREQKPITDYIVRDSAQVKSVYNTGSFNAKNPDVRYSVPSPTDIPEWDSQVNALINGSFDELFWGDGINRSSMYVRYEPTAMLQDIGLSDLPLVTTQKHAKDMMTNRWGKDGKVVNESYHSITEEQFRRLPELIERPVAVILDDPKSSHPGGINILTAERDPKGNPIFVTINPDQNSFTYGGTGGPAHFVNMFGREDYQRYIQNAINNGDIAYLDKEKIDAAPWLAPTAEPALSTADGIESGAIIKQKRPTVKPGERRFSVVDKPMADTFFSKMEQEIGAFKQAKMGAASVVAYLKGHGVKDEEIKWSGIEQWLEGKKSVTREELLEFSKLNTVDLEEQILDGHREIKSMEDRETGEVYDNPLHMEDTVRANAEMDGYDPEDVRFDYSQYPDYGLIYAYIYKDGRETELTTIQAEFSEKEPRWEEYKTPGGENYRELLYKMPGSEYSNRAMRVHWGDADEGAGVLAHARVQDFQTADGNMLFIEEIQSDWHNAGQKSGYVTKDVAALQEELRDLRAKNVLNGEMTEAEIAREAELNKLLYPKHTELNERRRAMKAKLSEDEVLSSVVDKIAEAKFDGNRRYAENSIHTARTPSMYIDDLSALGVRLTAEESDALRKFINSVNEWNQQNQEYTLNGGREAELANRAPEAPYSKNYHEYVLKRLLRMAAEYGYDSIGWTSGKMQEERWSSEYAEGYRIEYDQDIPKFLNKYGKQWGAKVEKARLDTGDKGRYDRNNADAESYRQDIAYWRREFDMADSEDTRAFCQRQIDYAREGLQRQMGLMAGPEIWTMKLTEKMKDDVLHKGQPRYSVPNDSGLNPDTGYERGSIADAIMQIMNTGDRNAATEMLRQAADLIEQLEVEYLAAERDKKLMEALTPKLTKEAVEQNKRDIDDLIRRYGRMPQTSAAQQEVKLPRKIDKDTKVRGFAQTAMAAGVTNEVVADELTQDILNGSAGLTYVPVGDKATMEKVQARLEKEGFEKLLHDWESIVDSGATVTKESIAMAEQLYVEACANKDAATAQKLVAEIAVMGTRAGQTVQAMTLLKKMTPSGKLYYLQKAVNRLNKEQKGRKKVELTIDTALAKNLLNAKSREEIDAAMDAIVQDLADQLPVTVVDKWNAWRYLAMLGNPRTHVRNIFGNVVFTPARLAKDLIAAGMEKAIPQEQRTKAVVADKDLLQFAKQDAIAMRDELTGGGKYNPADLIRDKRKVFKSKPLAAAEKFNSNALNVEDWWFLRSAYSRSLAGFLTARGAEVSTLTGADSTREGRRLLQEGRAYAMREAQKATYRDASKVAQTINGFKRNTGAFGSIFLDGVLPFTKTPINIVKRGIEYSPAGLIKGVVDMGVKVRRGDMTAAEGIDEICAGLTGTGIAVIGAWLTSLGLLTAGHGDDDEDEFEELRGVQEYSLTIGDTNYTIDWMAPVALPLFVGSEIYNTIAEWMSSGVNVSLDKALDAVVDGLATMAEPMLSLSMLDGLNKTLSANKYAGDDSAIYNVLKTVVASYFSQGVPTLLGQIARTMDGSRRTSFTPQGQGKVASWVSRTFQNSVLAKIPVLSEGRMLYIDAWGRADTEGNLALRAFENFLSPGYINTVKATDVDEELMRLAGATGDTGVFPDRATKSFTVNSEVYAMSQEEYQAHLIERGQRSYRLVSDIVHDPLYDGLDDETRAKAIEMAYNYVAEMTKQGTNPEYRPDKWMLKLAGTEERGGDAAEYILVRAQSDVGGTGIVEAALGNGALSNAGKLDIILTEVTMSDKFDDPYVAGYEYVMDEKQQARYSKIYRELLTDEFESLVKTDEYRSAGAGERADLVKNLKQEVEKQAERDMSDWLYGRGIESTKKNG